MTASLVEAVAPSSVLECQLTLGVIHRTRCPTRPVRVAEDPARKWKDPVPPAVERATANGSFRAGVTARLNEWDAGGDREPRANFREVLECARPLALWGGGEVGGTPENSR